ncbi:MAG TPA: hypothetical protein VGF34_04695 [Stellaceae bacterium]
MALLDVAARLWASAARLRGVDAAYPGVVAAVLRHVYPGKL